MGFLDKILGRDTPVELKEQSVKIEEKPVAVKPKKPSKPKKSKPSKAEAEPAIDPKVDILKVSFDKDNPRIGSFELDWNDEFVEFLKTHGYTGSSPEEIVDAWLMDVCRTISSEVPDMYNVRYIQRRDLGGGKTEFS